MKYLLILTMILTNLFSAPAYNAKRVFKQADGTEFTARANGNHHLNWIEDENGEILKYNAETKNFDYAVIEGTSLKPSGHRYQKQNSGQTISKAQRKAPKIYKKQLGKLMQKRKEIGFK
jgi:hypothetical protein